MQQLAANSATFAQKTEFSKAKYLKRKKKKYIITIQVQKPTAKTLCEAYFAKVPQKIRQLRVDSLAEILLHSDVKSGARILCYDRCGGLVVGSLLERLSGSGHLLSLFPGQSPAVGIVDQFNFTNHQKSILQHFPISALPNFPKSSLRSSAAATPSPPLPTAVDATPDLGLEPPTKKRKVEESSSAAEPIVPLPALRGGVAEASVLATVEQLKIAAHPNFDALVLVPDDGDDPLEMLRLTYPFLAGSGSVVIYSPYLQPLAECYQDLMESHAVVHIRLFETWHRVHQVLPMRTHPLMQMHGASGFILSGYKVKSSYGTPIPAPSAAHVPTESTSSVVASDSMQVDS